MHCCMRRSSPNQIDEPFLDAIDGDHIPNSSSSLELALERSRQEYFDDQFPNVFDKDMQLALQLSMVGYDSSKIVSFL